MCECLETREWEWKRGELEMEMEMEREQRCIKIKQISWRGRWRTSKNQRREKSSNGESRWHSAALGCTVGCGR